MSSPIVVSENYVTSSFIAHMCFLEVKAWSVGLGSSRIRVKVLFLFSFSLFSVMFLCVSGFYKHACDTACHYCGVQVQLLVQGLQLFSAYDVECFLLLFECVIKR